MSVMVVLMLSLTVVVVVISRRIKRELAIRKAISAVKKIHEYRNRTGDVSQSYIEYSVKNKH